MDAQVRRDAEVRTEPQGTAVLHAAQDPRATLRASRLSALRALYGRRGARRAGGPANGAELHGRPHSVWHRHGVLPSGPDEEAAEHARLPQPSGVRAQHRGGAGIRQRYPASGPAGRSRRGVSSRRRQSRSQDHGPRVAPGNQDFGEPARPKAGGVLGSGLRLRHPSRHGSQAQDARGDGHAHAHRRLPGIDRRAQRRVRKALSSRSGSSGVRRTRDRPAAQRIAGREARSGRTRTGREGLQLGVARARVRGAVSEGHRGTTPRDPPSPHKASPGHRGGTSGLKKEIQGMNWNGRPVLVTGGASFIGSHLVDGLVERGASVRIVDDLSSGQLENIQAHVDAGRIEFIRGDLKVNGLARKVVDGMSVVFHLAADHGGRGYVELHQSACALNMMLDQLVFDAAAHARVDKVVFASSGCVYPNGLQTDPSQTVYLTEDSVGPPFDADNMYGWAKLMGEMTLRAYCQDRGLGAASCRYFTVYGTRGHENHAVIAMIARAFLKQDPFDVWGNGEQIRNWTHVSDIVAGTILAADRIDDGTAVNLGTMERTRVIDAAREVLAYTGHTAEIRLLLDKPVGPMNRVADNALAARLLDWRPKVKFVDGLHRTIDWYFGSKDRAKLAADLERKLTER